MPGYVMVPKVFELTVNPFGGGIPTTNGVQYSAIVNSPAVAANEAQVAAALCNIVTFNYPGYSGKFDRVLIGLTGATKPKDEATNSSVIYRWQGRNIYPENISWYDLVANTTVLPLANGVAVWTETTWSGYVPAIAGFNAVPFTVRMLVASNTASNAQAKIKNSSYFSTTYRID